MNDHVALRLQDINAKHGQSEWEEPPKSVTQLIDSDPFAFLIAMSFDNGLEWRVVASIPFALHRMGFLDPKKLANMAEPELRTLLQELSVKPRWGAAKGAKTLSAAAELVQDKYGGDASGIWRNVSVLEAQRELRQIYGIGRNIANMITRILRDRYGYFVGEERLIDVKADRHLLRVFRRTGLISSESKEEAIRVARRLSPSYPAILDWGAWHVGRSWCHLSAPKCAQCLLDDVCPKHIS